MLIEYSVIIIFGLLIGNFATSLYYRLPRNISICGLSHNKQGRHPFCSICHHKLKFYEYLPILNWFSTLGKCNYCDAHIPYQYLVLELGSVIISYSCFELFRGITDLYIIIFCFGVGCLLNILIYKEHKFIPHSFTICMVLLGVIYRTLIDQTIVLWLASLSTSFIVSLFLLNHKLMSRHIIDYNQYIINILMLSSIWCPPEHIIHYAIIVIIIYIFCKSCKKLDIYSLSTAVLFCIVFLSHRK